MIDENSGNSVPIRYLERWGTEMKTSTNNIYTCLFQDYNPVYRTSPSNSIFVCPATPNIFSKDWVFVSRNSGNLVDGGGPYRYF